MPSLCYSITRPFLNGKSSPGQHSYLLDKSIGSTSGWASTRGSGSIRGRLLSECGSDLRCLIVASRRYNFGGSVAVSTPKARRSIKPRCGFSICKVLHTVRCCAVRCGFQFMISVRCDDVRILLRLGAYTVPCGVV